MEALLDFPQIFSSRIKATEALTAAAQPKSEDVTLLQEAGNSLESASIFYDRTTTGAIYAAFADLLRIAAQLVNWRAAVLNATVDADRFLRGAKERYRLWVDEYKGKAATVDLVTVASAIESITETQDVEKFCRALSLTPLPIGMLIERQSRSSLRIPAFDQRERPIPKAELAVAFLKFTLDGYPANDLHYLTPAEVHDIEIEVRASRWSDDAKELQLAPITIESSDSYQLPTFMFSKPSGEPPFVLKQRGRAVLKVAQGLHALPFEFKYAAEFLPSSVEQPVAVVGHRTLRIESFDLNEHSLTGYQAADKVVLSVRERLRKLGIPKQDLEHALILLKATVNLSGRAVQDALFKGLWNESRFQSAARDELRRYAEIGSHLDEHPHAAGGITDLSFHGIPIELKVVSGAHSFTLEDCDRFVDQTTSYTVGKGKRVGVLCVLDSSEKKESPQAIEDGIGMFIRHPEGAAVATCVVKIQGNLAKPSSLS